MNRTIFLISFVAIASTFAENPNWYPENDDEISKKCFEENGLSSEFSTDDDPTVHAWFLCKAKGFNVYNDETGLDVDRLIYVFYKKQMKCKKRLVQNCIDSHKDVISKGEMIYKIVMCIEKREQERMKEHLQRFSD